MNRRRVKIYGILEYPTGGKEIENFEGNVDSVTLFRGFLLSLLCGSGGKKQNGSAVALKSISCNSITSVNCFEMEILECAL